MSCPHSADCPLYEMFASSQLTGLWKALYCDDNQRFPECARYQLSLRGLPVSPTLMPNGTDLELGPR